MAKKNQPEIPRQHTQPGAIGCCPLSGLAARLLCEQRADALICLKDDPSVPLLRKSHALEIDLDAGRRASLSLEGHWFNGFSDAFFRGKLPRVILVTAHIPHQSDFFEEFADYCDKLHALGYFLQDSYPVEALFPCVVMLAEGCYFKALQERLTVMLTPLLHHDEVMLQQLRGQFVRGLLEPSAIRLAEDAHDTVAYPRQPAPTGLRLAGGSLSAQLTVQAALSARGLTVLLEPRTALSVERLEWESWLRFFTGRVVPAIGAVTRTPAAKASRWQHQALAAGVALAHHQGLLAPEESEASFAALLGKRDEVILPLGPMDLVTLETFARWSQQANLRGPNALFQTLQKALATVSVPWPSLKPR